DNAGGDPVQYIIHYTGMGALNSLLATLLISPIAKRFKIAALIQTRRLVSLYVCAYALLHISAFISLDLLFAWGLLFEEVIKRPYILVGAAALLIILLLALTSPNSIKRRMGKRWQSLHNWIYLAAILAPIHFYWSVKSEIIEPSIYIVLFAALLLYRKDTIYKWIKPKK
ncbi:protein-methionine-sulfoxide reductase heme-binding subunit MsrQ, partial [Shewanella sp. SG44-6]|uniref:protein-methionine-sulfoxide reductase heme-binding subunit MsrQ n=1 Tax=Shewanella sp. SG44-6 TaxID=2760959 RepID=UPI0016036A57